MPTDQESLVIISIFNSTPLEYGMSATSFNYTALKDFIRWKGLKAKDYVPILLECFNAWQKGKAKAS